MNMELIGGGFINYNIELYKIASENAEILGDIKKTAHYSKKYREAIHKIDYSTQAALMATLYQTDIISPLNEQLTEKKKTANFYGFISIAVGLGGIIAIVFAVSKSKRDKKKFLAVIFKLEQEEIIRQELAKAEEEESKQNNEIKKSVSPVMSDEADKKIEKQFSVFERKQHFLSPTISISSMAIEFSTNVRYLSEAIKKYKATNFNGYINDLRIEYIILKLKNNPEYSNYKIAYLAEECGFASHAVFNRAFVQKTGISPSKFITFLKEQNDQKLA